MTLTDAANRYRYAFEQLTPDSLDDLVVVGGLVPSLLIPDESLPAGEDVHIGTMELDLGLSLVFCIQTRLGYSQSADTSVKGITVISSVRR